MDAVLVLNIDYTPLEVISWRKAVEKMIVGKVELVEAYVDRVLTSPSLTLPFPAVVRVVSRYVRRRVRRSRSSVLARDGYQCQYCGVRPRKASGKPDLSQLTIDHVVPKAHAVDGWVTLPWSGERVRVKSWRNEVAACSSCNHDKADRTPGQAGLTLRRYPRRPSVLDIARMSVTQHTHQAPDEWGFYLGPLGGGASAP